jgi:phage host-nuclease inhibitor protein Gam
MKSRIKKKLMVVPDRTEMEILLGDVRTLHIALLRINAQREAAVKAIDDRVAPELDKINLAIEEKVAQIQAWAEANPREFENKKSLELTHGTIGFRTGTPALKLISRAWNWDQALLAISEHLPNFIRSVPEIDKEALIAQRGDENIQWALPCCGLKVTQAESFFIDPKVEDVDITIKKEAA